MSYQALYREWRPKTFNDMVEQEHIIMTLSNAIKYDRISHAYLFTGPRGTGKTSVAKVFGKSLNCSQGPTTSPCGSCHQCLSLDEGRLLDVIEIDAASNRGIDEIRELRDQVAYSPSEGRYKIYIIDEVHMLTTEAFNALLKTLEEPPTHVVFILATTEPHKLPMTVLSRCQRFDFNRISVTSIIDRLTKVIEEKGITAESEALTLIARNADGALRDALSLLDQCLSYSDDELASSHVLEVIGSVSEDVIYQLLTAVINQDIKQALYTLNNVVDQGKDLGQFLNDIILYLRDILLVKLKTDQQNLMKGSYSKLSKLEQKVTSQDLIVMIDLLSERQQSLKWAQNPRLILEMSLYRLINLTGEEIQMRDRVNKLEQELRELKSDNSAHKEDYIPAFTEQSQNEYAVSKDVDYTEKGPPETNKETNNENIEEIKAEESNEELNDNSMINSKDDLKYDLQEIKKYWSEILEKLKKQKITAHAFVIGGNPIEVKDNLLYLGFSPDYKMHMERAEKPENKETLEKIIDDYCPGVKVKCVIIEQEDGANQDFEQEQGEKDLTEVAKQEFGASKVEVLDDY